MMDASKYSVGYYRDAPQEAIYIDLTYTLPLESQQQLMQVASALAAQAQGEEFHREWFLHDALCQLVTYDASAANQHNAYGALVDGGRRCPGRAAGDRRCPCLEPGEGGGQLYLAGCNQ